MSESPVSNRKKSYRKPLSIVIVVVVALGAWWWLGRSDHAAAVQIETETVTRGPLRETISATGQLQALETIPVGTQVSGTIDKIYVDFNSKVKRGQLLASLDPSVLDAQLENARASLSQAQARYNDAKAAYEEGQELLAKAYISEKELRTLKTNLATTAAAVEIATAEFNRAKRNRQYADIYSPIDGVVIERAVDRGQTVASGFQTPTLFTIANDLKQMQIVASVDESQIGSVKVGQPASFTVSAFPGRRFTAAVKQIRLKPTTTQNVVTYHVVLSADNSQGDLYPGMTATVDFVLKEFDDVLRVPSAALRVQRIPEELMDAETLKREKELAKARQTGRPPAFATNGEGGPSPEQLAALRQRMTGGGGAGLAGRGNMASLWVRQPNGKYARVMVRVLGSDLQATAVEPLRGELKVNDTVITKVVSASLQQTATRSILPGPPQGGPRRN